jgi:hypothetical protein
MATRTQYLGLTAPQLADQVGSTIPALATNMSVIDAEFGQRGVNVKWYGAKGDGVTDDTTAIQNAIANAPANSVLVFPPGTYYFSTVYVQRSNLTIFGYGATLVTSVTSSTGPNIFQIVGSNITIMGLSFQTSTPFNVDTTYKAPASGGGLMIRIGTPGTPIQNITLRDVSTNGGFGGIDIQHGSYVRVLNCNVQNAVGNGINFADCPSDILVEGNIVTNTRDDMIVCVCDSGLMQGTENFVVRNNRVMNGYAKGICTTGVNTGQIVGNWIENTWTGGIQPFQDSSYNLAKTRNLVIAENTIIYAGKNFGSGKYQTSVSTNCDGIYVSSDTRNLTIVNNRIISPQRYGINVGNGASRIMIRGNDIIACGSSCIAVGNTSDTTITSAFDVHITDNNCVDAQGHGMVIGGLNEGTISRNKVKSWSPGNRAIYVKNCSQVVARENVTNDNITTTWAPNVYFYAGQYILPATPNGHSYYCTVSGLSGSTEPSWNTSGGTTVDGTVTWQDNGASTSRGTASTVYIDTSGSYQNVISSGNIFIDSSQNINSNTMFIGGQKVANNVGVPTSNAWNMGDISYDTSATAGRYAGWVCTTAGTACGTAWTSGTTYAVGTQVYYGSTVYQVTVAGSGASTVAPTNGSTADGYTWTQVGALAAFKPFGAVPYSVSDMKLTTTSSTTVASFTPTVQSNYEIKVYYRVVNATTNLTITVTYTDGSGTQQSYSIVNGGSQAVGPYSCVPVLINATSASPITVTATAGTANNVYVSCTIKPE